MTREELNQLKREAQEANSRYAKALREYKRERELYVAKSNEQDLPVATGCTTRHVGGLHANAVCH